MSKQTKTTSAKSGNTNNSPRLFGRLKNSTRRTISRLARINNTTVDDIITRMVYGKHINYFAA